MGYEIERKFLIDLDAFGEPANGQTIKQGFLPSANKTVVRVRLIGDEAFLTIKGENNGISRLEFEYPIPVSDAQKMLKELCHQALVEKIRYAVQFRGHCWEVDIFEGDNQGLVVAEIELNHADEAFFRPPWLRQEVSDDPRYYNSNLIAHPYNLWTD